MLGFANPGRTQEAPTDSLTPLESGSLLVWVVVPPKFSEPAAQPRITHEGLSTHLATGKEAAQTEDSASESASVPQLLHDVAWDLLFTHLRRAFPNLDVDFEYVTPTDVAPDLDAAKNTDGFPDVLLGAPLATPYGVTASWRSVRFVQTEDSAMERRGEFAPEISMSYGGRNSETGRAFALWLADEEQSLGEVEPAPEEEAAAAVARRVTTKLLQGKSVEDDTDPEIATLAVKRLNDIVSRPTAKVGVTFTSIQVNPNSAVIAVRATVSGGGTLEVSHALLVLRRDGAGRWRMLHISWNPAPRLLKNAVDFLDNATSEQASAHRNEGSAVLGISQATPKDGDTRPPQPDLWWDNLGGATLQVVEWQAGGGIGRLDSILYFVPDVGSRLRTSVVARFAAEQTQYIWRVWSVGADGTIVLSPWRTLNIGIRR